MKFLDLVVQNDKKFNRKSTADKHILCFDPGHTTGWAYFHKNELQMAGQIATKDMHTATHQIVTLYNTYKPDLIICEDYRVYSKFKDQHVGSQMLTTRVIGCIETIAAMNFINVVKQMAHVGKGFCKDDKLKMWGYFGMGQKHARDAIRHGCHYILFDQGKKKDTINPHKITMG